MISQFHPHANRSKYRRWIPVMIVLGPALLLLAGALIMVMWNWLMPAVFGLGKINLWIALGLFFLSRILFGSFHPRRDKHQRPFFYGKDHSRFADWWEKEGKAQFENYHSQTEKE